MGVVLGLEYIPDNGTWCWKRWTAASSAVIWPQVSVQYQVVKEAVYDAFYKLTDSKTQITSYGAALSPAPLLPAWRVHTVISSATLPWVPQQFVILWVSPVKP